MKKFVKILAALAVSVAAFAFVSCSDGTATPAGTIEDGTYSVSSVTYNGVTVEKPGADASAEENEAWSNLPPEMIADIVVSDFGTKVDGVLISDLIKDAKEYGNTTIIIQASGSGFTVYSIDNETDEQVVQNYKK